MLAPHCRKRGKRVHTSSFFSGQQRGGKSRQIYGIFGTPIAKGGGGENFTLNCNKCRDSGPQSEIATQILEKLYTRGEFLRIYGS
jgi:hypothetical protein